MDGMSKTRKGDREIISVSLPVDVYDVLQDICEKRDYNRSALIASAITNYLKMLGLKGGER